MTEYRPGQRVEAVRFALDEGLRIWPIQEADGPIGEWRVVQVNGQRDEDVRELFRGSSADCVARYPNARYGINDNESVPPGTTGLVEQVLEGSDQVWIRWDNGRKLALTPNDVVRAL